MVSLLLKGKKAAVVLKLDLLFKVAVVVHNRQILGVTYPLGEHH